MKKGIIVTGSNGLIGSEVCLFFGSRGFEIHGIDNNQRAVFFGPQGDTRANQGRVAGLIPGFFHHEEDIRNREGMETLIKQIKPALIIHTAAQPSHDRAAAIPFDDFDTNAVGTLNLLEAARRHCPESPFIHMSTNKVYGDAPNRILLRELDKRWDYAEAAFQNGIDESCSIDQSKHSLFGASKLAGDILAQEYGRYFGMPTCCLRGGCLTGPHHCGVELHGFLSYLVKCNIEGREYQVHGYKGKQVRDNIHSEDVAAFMHEFFLKPRCGEVYNLGGGKANSCSILEAFELAESFSGRPQKYVYLEESRSGDHTRSYSALRKLPSPYPKWSITKRLPEVISEIVQSWQERLAA